MMNGRKLSHALSGVLYAEDFDEPLLQPARTQQTSAAAMPAPEIITPTFSLDELRAATDQAYEEGCEATRHTAARSSVAQRDAALAALAGHLSTTQKQSVRIVEQALDAIACTTLSLLTVALPALCANYAEDELRALLQRVLPPIRQLPEMHIRVHPSLREALEEETGAVLDGSGTRITWIDSSKLAPGDIAITWQNGGALRNTGATCTAIRDAVLGLFDQGHEIQVPETHLETSDGQ